MVSRREVPVKNPAKPHKQKGEKAQFLPENGEHIVVEGFSERGLCYEADVRLCHGPARGRGAVSGTKLGRYLEEPGPDKFGLRVLTHCLVNFAFEWSFKRQWL